MTEEEYFELVESFFQQRRGNPFPLSPKEWSLIVEWHGLGIPSEIVLRAIDSGFTRRKDPDETPLSLTYFRRIVKAEYKRYLKSLEGSASTAVAGPEAKTVRGFVGSLVGALEASAGKAEQEGNRTFAEFLSREKKKLSEIQQSIQENQTFDLQRVEHQLTTLEKEIEEVLLQMIPDRQMQVWKEEAMRELKIFEQKVEITIYREMVNRAVIKSVRRLYNIPRLSVFYM